MAREEKTLTELEFQPTLDVDRGNDLIWTVDVSDKSMSAYGTSKKVKVEAFIGDKGEKGESSYSYIAYASDSSGSDFTMVFNENLDYIAIKTTTSPIVSPQASDFTGLWKNYKGVQGLPGVDGKGGKDGIDGIDGASSYTYIAYASDSSGTDFTMTFNSALDYIAIKTTSTPIVSPQALDFAGLWKNYKGATGTAATVGVGTTTTLNPGQSASVSNSGSSSAAVFDFGIPKGADGLDINWRGVYDNLASYVVNDSVFYNGSSYICILNSSGNLPTNTTYWNLMAQQGSAGTGSGDVSGPSSSTDDTLARFDGVTGKLIQGSLVTVNDSGSVNIPSGEQYLVDGSPVQGYSDKEAQDAVGDILEDTATVGLTYDDTEPSITADIKDSSIGNSKLATMASKTYKGRTAADTGAVEDVPIATLKTDLGLTKSDIGLSNVDDLQQMPKSYLDTDATLAANSDEKVPSQKAVKAYADSKGYAWKGAWATATAYALNDTVENNGSGYICISAHTSGASTEPGVGGSWKSGWDLFVEGMGEPNITEDTTTDLEGYLYGDGSNVGVKSEQDIIDIIMSGWSSITDTWTYNSTDNPTGVINWTGANSKVSAGMRIRFNNGGNTIYGIVTAVTGSSMTFLHEMNEANNNAVNLMANSAITNAYVSAYKAPLGFTLNPDKWSVYYSSGSQYYSITNPSSWQKLTGSQLVIPIGVWVVEYNALVYSEKASGVNNGNKATLSTTTNSETDSRFTRGGLWGLSLGTSPVYAKNQISISSKTTYSLLVKNNGDGASSIGLLGADSRTVIQATCAYL